MRNQLIVEMGGITPGTSIEQAMEALAKMRGLWLGWKAEGQIEAVHEYSMVTGNRTERMFLIVLEVSKEQLDALVTTRGWVDLMMIGMQVTQNFTTHRAVALEEIMSGPPEA